MRFKDFLESVKENVTFDKDGRSSEYHEYEEWQRAVKKAHPDIASKIQFKANVKLDQIEAIVRGEERVYGIWKGEDDGTGVVLEDLMPKKLRPLRPLGYRQDPDPNPEAYKYLKDKCRLCGFDRGSHKMGQWECPKGGENAVFGWEENKYFTPSMHGGPRSHKKKTNE